MFSNDPVLLWVVLVGVVGLGVCTELELALASLDKTPPAAGSCMARLGWDLVLGLCHVCSISQRCARAWESCKAAARSLGDACVRVNTAPDQPFSTGSAVSS